MTEQQIIDAALKQYDNVGYDKTDDPKDTYISGAKFIGLQLQSENTKLKEQVAVLKEALKPFADMFPELAESKVQQGGKVYEYNKAGFTVADLFTAYNLLNKIK